jgi:hypothetical protein
VEVQGGRLLAEMRHEMQKEVFRSLAQRLFTRLKSKRKRVIGERQLQLLEVLLQAGTIRLDALYQANKHSYANLKDPVRAMVIDVHGLEALGTLTIEDDEDRGYPITIRLDWPTEMTESEFFERMRKLPRAKTHPFLR